jgi:RNA polymerase sigma factor (sigma-70 family)
MSTVSSRESPGALTQGARPLAVPRRLLKMRSDAVLAERVAAGDETAFDVLYERHRPVVLAVCMGVLGTIHDAEDATQETFSALSVALRNKIPAELRPWLIRVARNASIDTTRRRKHRLLTFDGELPDIAIRPSADKAEFESVMDGIRELPEQQRTALLMRELGGHSYAEIAEFLEADEDAVRGLIARARVGLRTYREASELPCAAARACIETEPDGRRYDKTIRRHLRGCAACRSYRMALRGDAKALRAALPFQTGGAFGGGAGGLSTGALGASKAALLGAGMTQVAATCAASVCAVGTVGGMVLIDPVHLLSDHFAKPVAAAVARPHKHASRTTILVYKKPAAVTVERATYVAPRTVSPGSSATHKSYKGHGFGHRHLGGTPPGSMPGNTATHGAAPTGAAGVTSASPYGGGNSHGYGSITGGTGSPSGGWPGAGTAGSGHGTVGGSLPGTGSLTGTGSVTGAGSSTGVNPGLPVSPTTPVSPATPATPTPPAPAPTQNPVQQVTTAVTNVVHNLLPGLTGQSGSNSSSQGTGTGSPLGLAQRSSASSNFEQQITAATRSAWGQRGGRTDPATRGQHGTPATTSGSEQRSAGPSQSGWGPRSAPWRNEI